MIKKVKEKPVCFRVGGQFYDYEHGQPYPIGKDRVLCWVNGDIFATWIDENGERNWIISNR